ncbi:PA0069 family radical SAM protein [Azohydromonas caseinilytica]|uniref:PA0069 family radical SAM protein n=1 Tax=Azohydromonas caseinilytica TaxID=2728836 RepID=A0A848F6J0_9BURK|nr:PA0069 family radical SAM protein [Azohydromonas caseinilytica]NML14316.1 PA0069 family radical SAM protein [Azohydromonas caseinilytica]
MRTAHTPAAVPLRFMPYKGRGASGHIASRFEALDREGFDDGWGTLAQAALQERAAPRTQLIEQHARTILSGNDSPDIPFDLSINPYRGCEHGCIYCFARPTHSYLDFSPGLDFETRIVAKTNAAEKLHEAFASPGYEPALLSLGSATDAYQPAERQLRITRGLIEVLSEHRHAFSIVTKSAGIERDLDLIAPMAAQRLAAVYVSITTLDVKLARLMEPRAAAPARRLRTIETLARAGVPVGVSVSPLIPLLNEPELERILEAARDAGASRAFSVLLRLPWEVNPLFQQWLQQHFPQRAAHVMARMRELRGGRDNDARFGRRMRGQGVWAELLSQRLHKACARLGLNRQPLELDLTQFRRPAAPARQAAAVRRGAPASALTTQLDNLQGELF